MKLVLKAVKQLNLRGKKILSKKTAVEPTKEIRNINKQNEKTNREDLTESLLNPEEDQTVTRSKSHSTSSLAGDLDDDDCINIRTDGELLDTAEEINFEDISKKNKDKDLDNSKITNRDIEKKRTTLRRSPLRLKEKSRSADRNPDRPSPNETTKRQSSPTQTQPKLNEKMVDARELLNRKKAAKQSDSRTRSRSRERSWSTSPPRRRRDDERNGTGRYREDRENKRVSREDEREQSNRRVTGDERKERKGTRDKDLYSSKRRGDDRSSRRDLDSRDSRRRDSSGEPPTKRVLEKPFRNKVNEWESSRPSKVNSLSEGRKVEMDSSVKRREPEEPMKRGGMVSRVVARPQEPEDSVDTPVPSVVKVTPRPRRPPSQQASSNLIIKAISEANKSLASLPQRPDSTQRGRKEPVFTRTLRQSKRIPPEKIAVSITNPFALQNNNADVEYESNAHSSPKDDEDTSNQSTPNNVEVTITSTEPEESAQNEVSPSDGWIKEEKIKNETEPPQKMEEPEIELEIGTELEAYEETEEMSDPQFVVTLNGYDPDGLFSQSGEEGDDEWMKDTVDEEPLLTSTPDQMPSPQHKRNSSPVVFKNAASVNHSNLIEVELLKPKNTERCKYWPACRLADKCTFYHPTKPCKVFPACKFGDGCLYIHPQCKFNALCTRKDCVFAHTPAHTPMQPAAVPKAKAMYAAAAPLPCKYYPNCTNLNCQFAHPARACRFGLYCTKKDCSFDHGQVASVDKLKWTRLTTT
uniref:Zinc finger CCCH domain-containing protein 14 n=1 Tax=Graphocephala atropunctata TaxID=36148 RepID=A0A1B6KG46_9HEMI